MKKEKIIITLLTMALVACLVGGYFIYDNLNQKNKDLSTKINELEEKKIPLMGVMGAFVFAAQMINFTIPGTGSSGHIGGGLLLASILGPAPAFLVMSTVLIIQALFFAICLEGKQLLPFFNRPRRRFEKGKLRMLRRGRKICRARGA